MEIRHTGNGEDTFTGYGGVPIYYSYWSAEGKPQAVLIIVHGLGEHSGRYQYLVDALVPEQISVYAFDLRGHGRSGGKRGVLRDWREFRQDLDTLLALVRGKEPGVPVFLMGHSLGGLIALDYVLEYSPEVKGVITSSPALVPTAVSKGKVLLAKILSRLLPDLQIKTGLDSSGISSQPEEVKRYQEDLQVHDWGTPRLGTEILAAQARTLASAERISVPLLIVHGEADSLTPVESSQDLFQRVATSQKKIITYPGSYHEIHNDFARAQEFEDLIAWINRQLDVGQAA
jgi:alpha-beta hydrolase superfamily lysophospholipase